MLPTSGGCMGGSYGDRTRGREHGPAPSLRGNEKGAGEPAPSPAHNSNWPQTGGVPRCARDLTQFA